MPPSTFECVVRPETGKKQSRRLTRIAVPRTAQMQHYVTRCAPENSCKWFLCAHADLKNATEQSLCCVCSDWRDWGRSTGATTRDRSRVRKGLAARELIARTVGHFPSALLPSVPSSGQNAIALITNRIRQTTALFPTASSDRQHIQRGSRGATASSRSLAKCARGPRAGA